MPADELQKSVIDYAAYVNARRPQLAQQLQNRYATDSSATGMPQMPVLNQDWLVIGVIVAAGIGYYLWRKGRR